MTDLSEIYNEITIRRMRRLVKSLSERDRRAYVAVEAYKPGSPGVVVVVGLFGMSTETIEKGRDDLDSPERLPPPGRKGVCSEQRGLEAPFDTLVETPLGGDPMNEDVVWTDLQPSGIVAKLTDQGFSISNNTARELLKKKTSASANASANARTSINSATTGLMFLVKEGFEFGEVGRRGIDAV